MTTLARYWDPLTDDAHLGVGGFAEITIRAQMVCGTRRAFRDVVVEAVLPFVFLSMPGHDAPSTLRTEPKA